MSSLSFGVCRPPASILETQSMFSRLKRGVGCPSRSWPTVINRRCWKLGGKEKTTMTIKTNFMLITIANLKLGSKNDQVLNVFFGQLQSYVKNTSNSLFLIKILRVIGWKKNAQSCFENSPRPFSWQNILMSEIFRSFSNNFELFKTQAELSHFFSDF